MSSDFASAKVRLGPDADYDSATPERPRKGTVVVPRSDPAGRQDGRIPPGIAAEMGLIPRLRAIGVESAHLSRKIAANSGKSGDEMYDEFYRQAAGRRTEMTPEEKLRILTEAGYEVYPDGRVVPPSRTAATPAGSAGGAASVTGTAKQAESGGRRSVSARHEPQVRVPAPPAGDSGGDTLDDFYDELAGLGLGTDEVRARRRERPVEAAEGRLAGLPPAPAPRVREAPRVPVETRHAERQEDALGIHPGQPASDPVADRIARLSAPAPRPDRTGEILAAAERIAAERDAALGALEDARYALAESRAREAAAMSRLEAELRSPRVEASETVRVQLGGEQAPVTVYGAEADGGKWRADLTGRVDFGRSRRDMVLSVIDPAYASELLAVIRSGDCTVETGGVCTPCAYAGVCDKIYGDPQGTDFITLFRFRVSVRGENTGEAS